MNRLGLAGLLTLVAIVLLGLWYWMTFNVSPSMSLSQAIGVAQTSACTQKGALPGGGTYNSNSKAWWLDFSPHNEFVQTECNPACVVSTESNTAEINWRCTGAIQPASKDDLITVDTPLPNTTVQSPLTISGKARGPWYFEASFPLKLIDSSGKVLAQTPAQAQSDWMTNEYVPFSATLTFATPTTATGTLVLEKDNPSGLPQNANQLEIPITFNTTHNSFSEDGNVARFIRRRQGGRSCL